MAELGPAEQGPVAELRPEVGRMELGQAGPEQGPGPVLVNREAPPPPPPPPHLSHPGRQQTDLQLPHPLPSRVIIYV